MIDFKLLAENIYKNEMEHKNCGVLPTEPYLSTFRTLPTLQEIMPKLVRDDSSSRWDHWWNDWSDTRTKVIKRFGQITPEVEVIVIEKTLREHFDT